MTYDYIATFVGQPPQAAPIMVEGSGLVGIATALNRVLERYIQYPVARLEVKGDGVTLTVERDQ